MLEIVRGIIETYGMIGVGELILVGVSGGPDSIALLHCLHCLSESMQFSVHVVHINHGIRPEAIEEADFVAKFAGNFGIGVTIAKLDGVALKDQGSFQARAREERMKIFADVSQKIGATKVALGHNANDQAETILQRLLRGGGSGGLSGILPIRDSIIHPLLFVSRKQIEAYLSQNRLDYRHDSSNFKPIYLRNRIRLELLPMLEANFNPRLVETLGKTALILQEENNYMDLESEKNLAKLAQPLSCGIFLPLEAFELELPLIRRVVRKTFARLSGDPRGLEYDHVERVIKFARQGESGGYIELPGGLRLYKEQAGVVFTRGEIGMPTLRESVLQIPGETYLDTLGITITARIVDNPSVLQLPEGNWSVVFDFNSIKFPIIVRSRSMGDKIWRNGSYTKLKEIFSRQKLPVRLRESIPILVQDDEVLWIPGLIRSDRAKVLPSTPKILELIAWKN
ncbi:MAG: tRNA lysidine(34) synthetase TilS [Peptococcaceae bacterium]|nr:tRNA lysidine(34) synthetase TilS [Peptococcaceae bacterium]